MPAMRCFIFRSHKCLNFKSLPAALLRARATVHARATNNFLRRCARRPKYPRWSQLGTARLCSAAARAERQLACSSTRIRISGEGSAALPC